MSDVEIKHKIFIVRHNIFFFFGQVSSPPGIEPSPQQWKHKSLTVDSQGTPITIMFWNVKFDSSKYLGISLKKCTVSLGKQLCLDIKFSWVQSPSCVRLFATPWSAGCWGSLSITNYWSFHWVGDAIQPSISSSVVSSLHQVAKVLKFQLQHQSFQWTFSTDFF